MASAGNRIILLRSRSLALCRLGDPAPGVELLPEAFLGLGEALDLLVGNIVDDDDPEADPEADTAAFNVLSNICKSFRASGPNLEGSLLLLPPRNEAAGEYIVLLLEALGAETLGLRLFD